MFEADQALNVSIVRVETGQGRQIGRGKRLPVRDPPQFRPHRRLQIGVGELNGYRFWVRFPFYHNGCRARALFFPFEDVRVVRAHPVQVGQAIHRIHVRNLVIP